MNADMMARRSTRSHDACELSQVTPPLSAPAKDFIKVCLRQRPQARPTVKQLLQHAWIAEHCVAAGESSQQLGGLSRELISAEAPGAWSDVLEAVDMDTARRVRESQR